MSFQKLPKALKTI